MFGYVIPIEKKLSPQAQEQYRADYCGLCRCLGKQHGFFCRFLVSYDVTFLYALLSARQAAKPAEPCHCPAHPFCKKQCRREDSLLIFCADVSVLLFCWKLRDNLADDGFWNRMASRFFLRLFRRAFARAEKRQPEFAALIAKQMDKLRQLEQAQCASIDRPADTFATLLQGCAEGCQDASAKRILRQLLYHTGRYLYLVDALDDLKKDCADGCYNPLRYRYHVEDGALAEPDKEEFVQSVDYSVGMAASALELLDCASHRELLENIIYYGMPAVLKSVGAGKFRKKRNRSDK